MNFGSLVRYCATVVVLMLVLVPMGICQTASNQAEEPTDTIEEIVVYGEKSLQQLRLEVLKAEDKVYALFNSLNGDDEYDIHCYREVPIGSHIPRRICRANFEATSELAREMLRGGYGYAARARIFRNNKLLSEKIEALAVERPEFLEAISEFSDADQILKSERQRLCEGRVIFCQ